jgi:hypothetical protein
VLLVLPAPLPTLTGFVPAAPPAPRFVLEPVGEPVLLLVSVPVVTAAATE